MRNYIVANWKMNGRLADLKVLAQEMRCDLQDLKSSTEVVICPPLPYIYALTEELSQSRLQVGAQDCGVTIADGAFTGEVNPLMLADLGCGYVILGHSERRTLFEETSDLVNQKASAAHQSSLCPIICIGESKEDYEQGRTKEVLEAQLSESLPATTTLENTIIAYEPVWAIGTGLTPTLSELEDIHGFLKQKTQNPVLYGGSVKGENAEEILSIDGIDGVLVGGASLKAKEFCKIARSC